MLDVDGLPLDEVGQWAKEKHERLRQYIDITRGARKGFVERSGGASYIDPYCGSGRAFIRDTHEKIDGSPLIAFKCARDGGVPFSDIFIADASEERCRAAEQRIIAAGGAPKAEIGDAEQTVSRVVRRLNPYGLHFAFLDPFNLQALPFSVLESFASLKRIDMLIHVSVQDLQRNLRSYIAPGDNRLERFVPGWRNVVDTNRPQHVVRAAILKYWTDKIEGLGLSTAKRVELIAGPAKNQRLYWLVLVARHDLARQLWNKISSPTRQGELF